MHSARDNKGYSCLCLVGRCAVTVAGAQQRELDASRAALVKWFVPGISQLFLAIILVFPLLKFWVASVLFWMDRWQK